MLRFFGTQKKLGMTKAVAPFVGYADIFPKGDNGSFVRATSRLPNWGRCHGISRDKGGYMRNTV